MSPLIVTPVHGCWHQIVVAKQLGAMAFKGAKPSAVVMDCLPNMQQDAPGQVRPLPSGKLLCRSPLAPYYPMPLCKQGMLNKNAVALLDCQIGFVANTRC